VHFILLYDLVDDYINRRAPYRSSHLDLVREAVGRGELLLAGAFGDPADGAALVFRAENDSVVRRFVENDPYVREGLVTSWRIRTWSLVVGGGEG
jgi:uncharacterized protein